MPERSDERTYLRDLSVKLEDETMADSIPTIERIYLDYDGRGVYECVYPGCEVHCRDAVKMWKHVHFSHKHGWSFGMSLKDLIAKRLVADDV